MARPAAIAGGFILLVVVSSCAFELDSNSGSGGGPGETVGIEQDGLSNCNCGESSYPSPVTVNGTVIGPTRSGSICWPVRYDRRSSGVTVDLIANDQDGNWVFNGIGQVQCISRCCFFDTEAGAERTLTSAFTSTVNDVQDNTISFADTNLWNDDAIALLTGLRHTPGAMSSFDGAGLNFPGDGNSPVVMRVTDDSETPGVTETMTGVAYSFFVGVAHTGHVAKKFIPPTVGPSQNVDTGFPTSRGICTISSLLRATSASSPAVTLTRSASSHNWVVSTGSTSTAKVACFDFNQTP